MDIPGILSPQVAERVEKYFRLPPQRILNFSAKGPDAYEVAYRKARARFALEFPSLQGLHPPHFCNPVDRISSAQLGQLRLWPLRRFTPIASRRVVPSPQSSLHEILNSYGQEGFSLAYIGSMDLANSSPLSKATLLRSLLHSLGTWEPKPSGRSSLLLPDLDPLKVVFKPSDYPFLFDCSFPELALKDQFRCGVKRFSRQLSGIVFSLSTTPRFKDEDLEEVRSKLEEVGNALLQSPRDWAAWLPQLLDLACSFQDLLMGYHVVVEMPSQGLWKHAGNIRFSLDGNRDRKLREDFLFPVLVRRPGDCVFRLFHAPSRPLDVPVAYQDLKTPKTLASTLLRSKTVRQGYGHLEFPPSLSTQVLRFELDFSLNPTILPGPNLNPDLPVHKKAVCERDEREAKAKAGLQKLGNKLDRIEPNAGTPHPSPSSTSALDALMSIAVQPAPTDTAKAVEVSPVSASSESSSLTSSEDSEIGQLDAITNSHFPPVNTEDNSASTEFVVQSDDDRVVGQE